MNQKFKVAAIILGVVIVAFVVGQVIGKAWLKKTAPGTVSQSSPITATGESELPKAQTGLPKAPGPNASDEEKGKFAVAIHALAQKTNTLEVGKECVLSPKAILAKEGTQLTIKNTDNLSHSVGIYTVQTLIEAKGQKTITLKFDSGTGLYGIRCDFKEESGFIEVTK